MPIKKTYAEHGDACASAHGIELIGDVWTYPILRELFLGPKRFSELSSLLHGVTPAVLTARLRDLDTKGLVQRLDTTSPAGGSIYQLTSWGHELERPLEGIARWAQSSPTWDPSGGLTPDAAVLAMKTMAAGLTSPGSTLDFGLTLFDSRCTRPQDYTYRVKLDGTGLLVVRESTVIDDADLRCDSTLWANQLFDPNCPIVGTSKDSAGPVGRFVAVYQASLQSVEN